MDSKFDQTCEQLEKKLVQAQERIAELESLGSRSDSDERLRTLIENLPGVSYRCACDEHRTVEFISPGIEMLSGYPQSDFIQNRVRSFASIIHPDDVAHVLEDLNILFDKGIHTHTYRFKHKNGGYVWVEDGLRLINDEDGNPQEIVGYWININERKQAEIELIEAKKTAEQANLAKSDFLSKMSHELRTPMNAILGFGQLLELNEEGFTGIQKRNINEILNAGYHLLNLINDMLDLAKIESGKLDVTLEDVHLNKLIKQCLTMISPQAKERELTLINQISTNNISVRADSTRLKQVLLNILSNAVNYNNDHGRITLNSELVDKNRIHISVTDTGDGLSEDDITKLFTPFERLNTASDIEGTGIGLVITKHLIELMGGGISVESTLGEGTTIWVELELSYAG